MKLHRDALVYCLAYTTRLICTGFFKYIIIVSKSVVDPKRNGSQLVLTLKLRILLSFTSKFKGKFFQNIIAHM